MITKWEHRMQIIIITVSFIGILFVAFHVISISEYRRGYEAGVASCCPEEIDVDEVTR